jgi:hypothetical protein
MFVSQIFDEASEILATTDKTKVFRKLTQAVQTLMESGHYFHTTQEIDVCTGWDGQTITLPRGIEVPLAVNVDGSPTYFRDRLFQYHVNKGGMYNPVDWAWDDRGFVATIMDIRQPSQLTAISEHSADSGKQIRVIGTDSNNRPLLTQLVDGTIIDGLMVPINAQSDFPLGSILPSDVKIETREAKINPLTQFLNSSIHQLQSGEPFVLSSVSGAIPNYLTLGNTYYVGVDDSYTIQLYKSQIDAKASANPIYLQNIANSLSITLKDARNADLDTVVNFPSAPPISIDSPNELVFTVGSGTGFSAALPSPLEEKSTYFGQPIDSQNIEIYASIQDAQNRANQIYLTGSSGKFNTDIRKQIAPQTILSFAIKHYLQNGDQVQAYTAGGNLPTPLIENQNYFAHVIDDYTISLHTTAQDATSSQNSLLVNPIIFTDSGIGISSIVKLLPATSTIGTANQITVPNLIVDQAQGSGATAVANLVGSVTAISITKNGNKYTSTPAVTFSSPPAAPAGSNQITYKATGYAVMAEDAPGSLTSQVAGIVITSGGLGYSSPPTITIDLPPAGGTAATAVARIETSFVSSFQVTSGGYGYTEPPQVVISGGGGNGATAYATINSAKKPVSQLYSDNSGIAYCKFSTNHNFSQGQTVKIEGATPSYFNVKTAINIPSYVNPVLALSGIIGGKSVTASYSAPHGYSQGQLVTFYGATHGEYNVTSTPVTVVDDYNVTYATSSPITVSPDGSANIFSSSLDYTTFTYQITGAAATASGAITAYAGNVTAVTVITEGTNYSSAPTVTILPSTGVFVQFSATGSLPSPLVAGTPYRIENANPVTNQFTILNSDFTPINITSAPTGNFYCVISRPFSISFNQYWSGNFSGLTSGQGVYLASDYLLPTGVNNTTQYFIRIVNSTTCLLFSSSQQAINSPFLTGLIKIISLGTGQNYFAIRMQSYAKAYDNMVRLQDTQFLTTDMLVQFDCSGQLPSPLAKNTDYKISLNGSGIKVYTTNGAQIIFATNGIPTLPVGQMTLNVIRTFSPVKSTKLICDSSTFELGQKTIIRANSGDTLPAGLSAGGIYYARPIDSGSFELYDTKKNAINTGSTTGRISYTSTGNNVDSYFYIDSVLSPIFVKAITHIEKPETLGYVSLYAFDYGRSNDMALVGQYHPTELNPKYRRIRIGKTSAWARIIYRVTHPIITSVYDYIPLENERAIIAAVHACDLEDKDFMEQAQKYWQVAINYLKNQNDSMDNHAMKVPQINNITYGDYTDDVMF